MKTLRIVTVALLSKDLVNPRTQRKGRNLTLFFWYSNGHQESDSCGERRCTTSVYTVKVAMHWPHIHTAAVRCTLHMKIIPGLTLK